MTRKSGDRPLDELERRFQALRDQVGALPEAGRPGLKTALQEVSQAIAALRTAGGCSPAEAPDCPAAADSPAPADAILRHVFSAIPDMLAVIDRDFNLIMTNWHESAMVPEGARPGRPKCYRVFHHRERPCKGCHVHKVFASGKPQKTEKINLLDGKTREFSAFPVLSKSGQVILAAEHVRDVTGRHQAAKALKESEERFRAIFEAAQDAIFIKDRSLHYTQVNPAMERLFDRPAADLIGKTDKDLFGAASGAQIRADDRRVLGGDVVVGANTRLVRGESKTFHVIKVPLHDDAGQVMGVCGIARDITELKQAEVALRESEERFKLLFAYAPDAYYLMDLQGNFLDVNRAAEEISGYGREELIGKNYQALPLFDKQQNSLVAALLQQGVDGGILGPVELNLKRKDGGNVIIEAKGLALHREGESLLLGIARDITARKRAEAALRESEERYRVVFEGSTHGILAVDMETGRFGYANPSICRMLGYSEKELLQLDIADLHPKDSLDQVMVEFESLARNEKNLAVAIPCRRKDGTVFYADVASAQSLIQGRRYAVGFFMDVTERRRAEEELVSNHAELQETTQRLEQSRNILQLVLESIPVRVFWKDADLRYLGCNALFALDAGLDHPEQLLGQDDFAMIWREQAEVYRMDDRQVMESRRPKINLVEPQTTPDGGKIWLKTSKVPLQMPNGEVFGVLGLYEDITAHKQAEEALKEREATLRTLIEANPESLLLLDTRGVILAANRVAAQRFDKTLEEIIGTDAFALVPAEVGRKRFEIFQQVVANGTPARFEDVRGDFHLDISMTPIFDQDKVVQVAVLGVDVSLRKLAEAALRESEARFRAIFDYTLVGVSMSDLTGRILQSNQALQQMLGYSAEELRGMSFQEITHPEDLGKTLRSREELLAGKGQHFSMEKRYLRKDGKILWAHVMVALLRDHRGEPQYLLATIIDRTAWKLAEAALRESEHRFRLMAETIQDVFWIATPTLDRVIYASPAYEQVWGYSCQELYEHPQRFVESIHPEDRDRALAAIAAAREQGSPSDHEYRIIKPDGAVRWIHDRGFPVRDEPGPGHPVHRGGQGHYRGQGPGTAAPPGPEDGSGGPAGRGHRPRLQQSPDGHHGLRRTHAVQGPERRPALRPPGKYPEGRRPGHGPDPAVADLQPPEDHPPPGG